MVDTRRSKADIVAVMKPEELTAKINSSKITNETKEILKLFVALFSNLQLETMKNIDKKVSDLDTKNKALQDEILDIKQTTEHQVSVLKEEISSLKALFRSQEDNHSSHLAALRGKLDSNEQYERRDALILSGPAVPEVSDQEDCKQIVRGLPRDHSRSNTNTADISIAHRLRRKPNDVMT